MTTRTLGEEREQKVLIVEDEPLNRDVLSRLLQLKGYATEEAQG